MLVAAAGILALFASNVLAANYDVTATAGNTFSPQNLTIGVGDSVTWTNAGGPQPHDVVFEDGSFQQPTPPSTSTWTATRTFNTTGTFPYYCSIHGFTGGIGMSGTVAVSAASTGTGTGTTPTGSVPAGTVGAQGQTVCRSQRSFLIRIRRPRGSRIRSAQVSVNGKPVKVSGRYIDGKLRYVAPVDLRGLTKGSYKVDIVVTTSRGQKLRGTRTYQTCAAKLTSSGLPPL
jgi:plastocyanin